MPMASKARPAPASLKKLDRRTLQSQIYASLKEAIVNGKFEPGVPMSTRGLAESFGTSIIPVREALGKLVSEGGFEILPRGSVAVPLMTVERFCDLRRARVLIEGYATELAASQITAKDVDLLGSLCLRMSKAYDSMQSKDFLLSNRQFRYTIYEAADSPILLSIIDNLWLQFGPFLNLAFPRTIASGIERHHEAVEALRKGDGPAARKAIVRDIMDTGDYIVSVLEDNDASE